MNLSNLSPAELISIRNVLQKWSIKTDSGLANEYRVFLKSYIEQYRLTLQGLSSEIWSEMDKRLPWLVCHDQLKGEARASASSAYIGILIYRASVGLDRKTEQDKKLDIYIVLIYLGSDYLLDDKLLPDSIKDQMKQAVKRFFKSPYQRQVELDLDPKVTSLIDLLYDITEIEPKSVQGLRLAWDSELNSELQKHETDCDKLWDISVDKGYKTVLMACQVINSGSELLGARELGSVTQLIDDLMDHKIDYESGINTFVVRAVYYHKNRNQLSLDDYIYRLMREIESMPNELWIIKIFFVQVACSCAFHNKSTSDELRSLLNSYLLDSNVCNFEALIKLLSP